MSLSVNGGTPTPPIANPAQQEEEPQESRVANIAFTTVTGLAIADAIACTVTASKVTWDSQWGNESSEAWQTAASITGIIALSYIGLAFCGACIVAVCLRGSRASAEEQQALLPVTNPDNTRDDVD